MLKYTYTLLEQNIFTGFLKKKNWWVQNGKFESI